MLRCLLSQGSPLHRYVNAHSEGLGESFELAGVTVPFRVISIEAYPKHEVEYLISVLGRGNSSPVLCDGTLR